MGYFMLKMCNFWYGSFHLEHVFINFNEYNLFKCLYVPYMPGYKGYT